MVLVKRQQPVYVWVFKFRIRIGQFHWRVRETFWDRTRLVNRKVHLIQGLDRILNSNSRRSSVACKLPTLKSHLNFYQNNLSDSRLAKRMQKWRQIRPLNDPKFSQIFCPKTCSGRGRTAPRTSTSTRPIPSTCLCPSWSAWWREQTRSKGSWGGPIM